MSQLNSYITILFPSVFFSSRVVEKNMTFFFAAFTEKLCV